MSLVNVQLEEPRPPTLARSPRAVTPRARAATPSHPASSRNQTPASSPLASFSASSAAAARFLLTVGFGQFAAVCEERTISLDALSGMTVAELSNAFGLEGQRKEAVALHDEISKLRHCMQRPNIVPGWLPVALERESTPWRIPPWRPAPRRNQKPRVGETSARSQPSHSAAGLLASPRAPPRPPPPPSAPSSLSAGTPRHSHLQRVAPAWQPPAAPPMSDGIRRSWLMSGVRPPPKSTRGGRCSADTTVTLRASSPRTHEPHSSPTRVDTPCSHGDWDSEAASARVLQQAECAADEIPTRQSHSRREQLELSASNASQARRERNRRESRPPLAACRT